MYQTHISTLFFYDFSLLPLHQRRKKPVYLTGFTENDIITYYKTEGGIIFSVPKYFFSISCMRQATIIEHAMNQIKIYVSFH